MSAGRVRGGRSVVALGLGALVVSWVFGGVAVAVVGIGLVLAGLTARLWARQAAGSASVERIVQAGGQPISWVSLACELQRDWARFDTVSEVVDIVLTTRLLATA